MRIIWIISMTQMMLWGAAGDLDKNFGENGKVFTKINDRDEAKDVVIQNDGKIVVAGFTEDSSSKTESALVRYEKNGDLDLGFGPEHNGKVTTDIGLTSKIQAIAIQSDRKIVASGFSNTIDDRVWHFTVIRYNMDGTIDGSFGTDGVNREIVGYVTDVTIQKSDEKIVLTGATDNRDDFCLVRYESNGTVDSRFGTDGIVITDINNSSNSASGVAIQSDGKIVVAGTVKNQNSDDFALVRYESNGSKDQNFGDGGIVVIDIAGHDDSVADIAIQNDGKIIITGASENDNGDWDFATLRYKNDGTKDDSFGTKGIVITQFGVDSQDWVESIAIQDDGKIVVGGDVWDGSDEYFAIARYNVDGSLDQSFGEDGKVLTYTTKEGGAQGVAIQNNGDIVVSGPGSEDEGSESDFTTLRYQGKSIILAPIYYLLQ